MQKARIILCVERNVSTFVVRFSALNHCSEKCYNNNNNIKCLSLGCRKISNFFLKKNMAF